MTSGRRLAAGDMYGYSSKLRNPSIFLSKKYFLECAACFDIAGLWIPAATTKRALERIFAC
jgi:hypothetical protein